MHVKVSKFKPMKRLKCNYGYVHMIDTAMKTKMKH
jgi:hypothetical protein